MKCAPCWISAVDERHARLFECSQTSGGRWHVEQRMTLENKWEDYHEHHRPDALGRGPSANAAQHFAAIGHEPDEEHRRFARDVAQWLTRSALEVSAARIDVFAAPKFLGLLRNAIDQPNIVELHRAELTRLSAPDLAAHPAVLNALQAHAHS